jgi:Mannosyl-glycoprotein endo-beta-N-acetylglucosaminidase
MLRKVGAFVILFAVSGAISAPNLGAAAPDLPEIVVGPGNAVPQCVTPGRLMAFLKARNPELNARYDGIATQYMRFGEQFGVRWDYAFYQMVVETGALSYWRGNRAGDVKPDQNNFAGLGATGGGERGESFKDIESGVQAHIEHVLLYAGRPVDNPVAERTRKVREWKLLDGWQASFKRPITYRDLGAKWAPGNRAYVGMIQTVAERFQSDACSGPDPRPDLVREARALASNATVAAKPAEPAPPALTPGEQLAQRAIQQAKIEGNDRRSSLGAQTESVPAAPSVPYKVMDPPSDPKGPAAAATPPEVTTPAAATTSAAPQAGPGENRAVAADKAGPRFALAGAAATKAKMPVDTATPPAANQKCRVWTASYGGQKSIIIRSVVDQVVNFTVLDVNAGAEAREAEAFIAAYARNGRITGEYASQAQALDKAFELCPES